MPEIIAIANQKGGVGKSTTCCNLSHTLSLYGKKTLVIDLDPQANSSLLLSGGEYQEFENMTISNVFSLSESDRAIPLHSLMRSAKVRGKDKSIAAGGVIYKTIPKLFFIPSNIGLSSVIEQGLTLFHRESILRNKLKELEDSDFDYVLLDCPPNLSLTTTNAILAATRHLIVLDRGGFSLSGLRLLIGAMSQILNVSPQNLDYWVLCNEYRKVTSIVNDRFASNMSKIESHILPVRIRRSQDIENASMGLHLLYNYKRGSLAVSDYKELAKQIYKRTQCIEQDKSSLRLTLPSNR
ncbi:ParA family protein [Aliivibrio fischeri]|uniref:ParA family protein n=1 Tax=Aliivibrio fischeri (strain MJ11) TaxID=388396 RepID=B5EVX9_ALIFM|nr:ParA family protein [Aliivibrio fischeri]ACH64767.1 ParA family protein [Aliivibrio fischeri MJ11]